MTIIIHHYDYPNVIIIIIHHIIVAYYDYHNVWLPSGKHTKNYRKSPFLMGKSTINSHFQ
jgi:hypothetical protein